MDDTTPRLPINWQELCKYEGETLPHGQNVTLDPRKVAMQLLSLRTAIEDQEMPPLAASTSLLEHVCRMIESMANVIDGLADDMPSIDPDLLESAARAICRADGFNPDRIVRGPFESFAMNAIDVPATDVEHEGPAWHRYRRGALHFLAMLDAVGGA